MFQEIMHNRCGGIAFYYKGGARAGDKFCIEKVSFGANAAPPRGVDLMRCNNCSLPLSMKDISPGLNIYDMADDEDMAVIYDTKEGV